MQLMQLLRGQRYTGPCSTSSSKPSRQQARRLGLRCHSLSASAVKPLTEHDLADYLASGCKPTNKFRIGTEHEKLGYVLGKDTRIPYEKVEGLLTALQQRYGWKPVMEKEYIIGLELDGQSISLEPGGQFELSGAPVDSLHKTCAETNSHLYQVKSIAEDLGIAFLGLGFDPKSTYEEVPVMPKQRYGIMREYMPKRGKLGLDMMFRSCTIQVNLDFESEEDMVKKFRVGLAWQPVATALFANSPFKEGKPTGYLSWRSHVWTDTDPDRCGDLPFVFEEGFGFEKYTQYALDVPMYFVYRDGVYHDASGQSFRDFMEGKLPSMPGELPTLKDWEQHLTTIFPEVRLKRYMEMRGADGGLWRGICALPALWVGLVYDQQSLDEAWELVKDWTNEERAYLREHAPRTALKTPFRNGTVQDLAIKMLKLSRAGLERRNRQEAKFLDNLEPIAESGVTNAELLLEKYYGEWNESVLPVFSEEYFY